MSVNQVCHLSSGEKLGFLEIGNPKGPACFFFHGFPGSSRQILLLSDHKILKKFRLIAIDRPGFGDSSLPKDRKLEHIVDQVDELAEALDIDKFHLIAVSGGNPYIFIIGDRMRDRVLSLTSICGLGPLHESAFFNQMVAPGQMFLKLGKTSPFLASQALARGFAQIQKNKVPDRKNLEKWISTYDAELIMNEKIRNLFRESMGHAFKQGAKGPAIEMKIIQQDWGIHDWNFPFPVNFWHGLDDRIVPPEHSRLLSERIPGSHLHLLPKQGHYTVPILHLDPILEQIPK